MTLLLLYDQRKRLLVFAAWGFDSCNTALAATAATCLHAHAQVRRGRQGGGLAARAAVPERGGARAAAAAVAAAPGRLPPVPRGTRHAVLLPQGVEASLPSPSVL